MPRRAQKQISPVDSRDRAWNEDSRPLSEVIRGAVDHAKNKDEWRARREHGPGASLERHWDRLPRGVKADVKDLAQWRDYYGKFTPFAQLCQQNGTDLYTALRQYNRLENALIADPVSGTMAIWDRLGLDRRIMLHAANQYVYDPHGWAAQQVNNLSYRTGASHMADAAHARRGPAPSSASYWQPSAPP